MVDPVEGQGVGISFDTIAKRVIEATSVILLVGFVLSLLINGWVFSEWRLSYLSVASTSDVLMDGIYFLFDLGYAVLAIAAGAILPEYLKSADERGDPVRSFPISAVVFTAVLLALIELKPLLPRSEFQARDATWFVQMFSSLFALGLIGTLTSAYSIWKYRPDALRWKVSRWLYGTFLLFSFCSLSLGLTGVVQFRRDIGYSTAFLEVSEGGQHCDSGAANVIWVGTDFSAARCLTSNDMELLRTDQLVRLTIGKGREVVCDRRWLTVLRRCRFAPTGRV